MRVINDSIVKKIKIINNHSDVDLNISLCADENYISYVGITIYSILMNNKERIHFHLFVTSISEADLIKIRNINFSHFNVTLYYINNNFFQQLPTPAHFSSAIYYRLVIPYLLSDCPKILYLDSDILCVNKINELKDIDINDYFCAAVEDSLLNREHLRNLPLELNSPYFNSGVLLINVEKWIAENVFDRTLGLIQNFSLSYPDQDALNMLFQSKVKLIPNKFNYIDWQNLRELKDICFLHFIGDIKPWHEAGFNKYYDQYVKNSPWKGMKYLSPSNTRNYRRFSKRLWRLGKKWKAIKYQIIYFIRRLMGKK